MSMRPITLAVAALTIYASSAFAYVDSRDAGSRAAPTNVGPMPQAPPMTGSGAPGVPNQVQCQKLLTRAVDVPQLRSDPDYESCKRRYPGFRPDGTATKPRPDAGQK